MEGASSGVVAAYLLDCRNPVVSQFEFSRAFGGRGRPLDHENRKTPISKPAANAQRPNVQHEITRRRIRKSSSCGISWD